MSSGVLRILLSFIPLLFVFIVLLIQDNIMYPKMFLEHRRV